MATTTMPRDDRATDASGDDVLAQALAEWHPRGSGGVYGSRRSECSHGAEGAAPPGPRRLTRQAAAPQQALTYCAERRAERERDERFAGILARVRPGLMAHDETAMRTALAALAARYQVRVVEDPRGRGASYRSSTQTATGPAVEDDALGFLHMVHELAHGARGDCPGDAPHYLDPNVTDSLACLQCETDAWFQVLQWIPVDRAQWPELVRCLGTYVDNVCAPIEAREHAAALLMPSAFANYRQMRVRHELVADRRGR